MQPLGISFYGANDNCVWNFGDVSSGFQNPGSLICTLPDACIKYVSCNVPPSATPANILTASLEKKAHWSFSTIYITILIIIIRILTTG